MCILFEALICTVSSLCPIKCRSKILPPTKWNTEFREDTKLLAAPKHWPFVLHLLRCLAALAMPGSARAATILLGSQVEQTQGSRFQAWECRMQ